MGPHEHAPVLVADEGEADRLPLMALGPAMDYARSVTNGCCSVKSAVALQGSIGHRFPGRPITVNVVFALVLLGLAGSVTDVLIVVRAAPAHRCPSDQLTMPALPHHPADPGPDQHAD